MSDDKPWHYSTEERTWPLRFPRWLVSSGTFRLFTVSDWRVFSVLLKYENYKTHECWPKEGFVATESGYSERTVIRTIQHLTRLRALKVVGKTKDGVNVYLIFQAPPGVGDIQMSHAPLTRRRVTPDVTRPSDTADVTCPGDKALSPANLNSYKENPMKKTSPPTSCVPPPTAPSSPLEVGAGAGGKQEETVFSKLLTEREKRKTDRAVHKGPDAGESAFSTLKTKLEKEKS